jgi:ubiquinone/menaquinone biosynthesis C-methylase UbiE
MEDATMVGTLRAQAEMIWPLERPLLERLGLPAASRVLDLGCGTGEITGRIAHAWPDLEVTGLDLFEGHLELARRSYPAAAHPNLVFRQGDAYATECADGAFGAVLLRHILHALPDRKRLLGEVRRLLAPGGLLYVLAEDYQGLVFDAAYAPSQRLFWEARAGLLDAETDLFHGRAAFREVRAAGFTDVTVHPFVVDTENTPRDVFARMLHHWRDGYAELIAASTATAPEEVRRRFDALIQTVLDPERYGCWLLLAVSARAP